jgi:DNA-binding CsgD family transcriptional regulator
VAITKIDRTEIARLRSEGKNVTQIARALNISRESVYRIEK